MERKNTSLINLIKQTQERSNANFEQQASLAPPPCRRRPLEGVGPAAHVQLQRRFSYRPLPAPLDYLRR